MTKKKTDDTGTDAGTDTTTAEELAAAEEPATDALMADLVVLSQEWSQRFKAQGLMVDELKAVMKKHGYVEPEPDQA
jgi:hypothetical protein